ncbi:hypothetical protein TVAG_317870 [Trichomonas vaginalis G3]|uniref:Uncharacterized protein n=1 Tax=Trichomonas vaginalis (strain ATCC PRA-98 / G3) TaxID=412133 RepID=A2F3N4_TRIV3|nr:hypothetical protein TVAGG3_0551540 [Trichomonas vaginalis G3]EAY00502.1 hypothetical protein TVAG_317870 [Trichomonas vaginalis G3]KAI5520540.1 hypothetical protein TVAGG3_0551540 [Trichomonas vaginalis G3]|eukprot:XP_001313431.1 hypothetical protein [Trichomonas vaginalis G3]
MCGRLIKPVTRRAPLTARSLPSCERDLYKFRNQLNAIRKQKDPPTSDAIYELKVEKQRLIEERDLLKVKITRYAEKSKTKPAPVRNAQIKKSLERQIKSLEDIVQGKKEELHAILTSDKAAQITEYQEELKILYLEVQRLKNSKKEAEIDLKDADDKVQAINSQFSDEVLLKRRRVIRALEKEILKHNNRNERLRNDLEILNQQHQEREESSENNKLKEQILELRKQIKQEKEAIENLQKGN